MSALGTLGGASAPAARVDPCDTLRAQLGELIVKTPPFARITSVQQVRAFKKEIESTKKVLAKKTVDAKALSDCLIRVRAWHA